MTLLAEPMYRECTMLEIVTIVSSYDPNEEHVIEVVRELVNAGYVHLTGSFAGEEIRTE